MSDIEIAQKANMNRIIDLALKQYGIESEHLEPYGHYKAKLYGEHTVLFIYNSSKFDANYFYNGTKKENYDF